MEAMLIIELSDEDFAQHPLPITTHGVPILPRVDDIVKVGDGHCKVHQIVWDFDEHRVYVFAEPLHVVKQIPQ